MIKNVFREGLVLAIICLFVGASVVPVIGTEELKKMFSEEDTTLVKSNSVSYHLGKDSTSYYLGKMKLPRSKLRGIRTVYKSNSFICL